MAVRQILPGAVVVLHYTEIMRLLSGDLIVQPGAVLISMPNDCTHSQRMDFLKHAAEIVKATKKSV